ncbi:nicotinamide phosphoribosyl transferase [Pseudomonas phage vB_PpuM-Roomu-2]|uniref:Nicotinamide phosphoribosyltransferase n=1 Tax=Pseudomonas phage vB_PpuM-Roomu-2 TaxID=3132621 RepID=A0AAX4N0H3_9CAUD
MFFEMMFGTDGYKLGHGPMKRKGTTETLANLTPRTDKIYRRTCTAFYDGNLVWVGGEAAIQEIHENWENSFFRLPKGEVIADYQEFTKGYLGRDIPAVEQMAQLHDLGYLPLEFRGLPEGSLVPMGVPVMTIRNTHPDFEWLVNYHETPISCMTWKTATAATIAREYKAICEHYLKATGCYDAFTLSVMCHDFSMRGMSGLEDAGRTGVGHLSSFIGTDSLLADRYVKRYYGCEGVVSISVPATEHAVTSNNIISIENEMQACTYEYVSEEQRDIAAKMYKAGEESRLIAEVMFVYVLITEIVPNGIVSNVSDTYDFWGMMSRGYPYLVDVIKRRPALGLAPGKLVVRPDSGVPEDVICGITIRKADSVDDAAEMLDNTFRSEQEHGEQGPDDTSEIFEIDGKFVEVVCSYEWNRHDKQFYYIDGMDYHVANEDVQLTPEQKGAIRILWETFGGTITETGHKLLDPCIGLIYGDSITTKRAEEILRRLEENGFAAANVVFGVGSYTYNCLSRDVFGFAVKATNNVINGVDVAIFKEPKTDSKKKSAKGRLVVYEGHEGLRLVDQAPETLVKDKDNKLEIFRVDGVVKRKTSFDTIRERLA